MIVFGNLAFVVVMSDFYQFSLIIKKTLKKKVITTKENYDKKI